MKRPNTIEGRVRYYSMALAEAAIRSAAKGREMTFEIYKMRSVSVMFTEGTTVTYEAPLDNDQLLNQFEANLEAHIEVGEEVQS